MQRTLHTTPSTLPSIFVSFILLSCNAALITYINSSFVEQFVTPKQVGLLFSAGAVLSLLILFFSPILIKKFGAYSLSLSMIFIELISLLVLSFVSTLSVILFFFIIYRAIASSLVYIFDLFLEEGSKNEKETGRIRGLYWGLSNIAFIIAPTATGFLLGEDNFTRVYFISSLFLIPILLVMSAKLKDASKNIKAPKYLLSVIPYVFKHKDIRHIICARFILQLFYTWMVIYTPVYLFQNLGFSWQEIGIILTIMLIPFIIFEIPAGYLADKKFGEKELLTLGFIVIGASTFAISQITTPSFLLIAGILFMTRVGASLVEIMTESYFFKHVNQDNSDLISVFRATSAFSYLIGPLLGSLVLLFFPYHFIFAFLGIISFWGIRYALAIKDTR